MPAHWCARLELSPPSTYAEGAAVLMNALSDQTSLPWPDEFPRNIRPDGDSDEKQTMENLVVPRAD
jgi:hypothetical protein